MYVVDGFEFQTKEEARQAKKESDGIRYIKDQTDMSDPDTVYKLYLRLNKPGYFFTPVGLSFLVELQEYLHTIPYIKNEDIRPIYIPEDKKAVVEVKKQTEGYSASILAKHFSQKRFSRQRINNILNHKFPVERFDLDRKSVV